MDMIDTYTGSGLAFKNVYNRYRGITRYSSGVERFNQSIALILETRVGESIANPDFGSKLHEVVFDPNTYILEETIDLVVRDAIALWEPRVEIIEVRILQKEDILHYPHDNGYDEVAEYNASMSLGICINYRVKKTNITNSYVGYIKINNENR